MTTEEEVAKTQRQVSRFGIWGQTLKHHKASEELKIEQKYNLLSALRRSLWIIFRIGTGVGRRVNARRLVKKRLRMFR